MTRNTKHDGSPRGVLDLPKRKRASTWNIYRRGVVKGLVDVDVTDGLLKVETWPRAFSVIL